MNKNGPSQKESQPPKRIIVLGVMRSGTSLTADLIRLWGAYAGRQEELWTSDASDPRGYYVLLHLHISCALQTHQHIHAFKIFPPSRV